MSPSFPWNSPRWQSQAFYGTYVRPHVIKVPVHVPLPHVHERGRCGSRISLKLKYAGHLTSCTLPDTSIGVSSGSLEKAVDESLSADHDVLNLKYESDAGKQSLTASSYEGFTGDELHFVDATDGWRLALWRYRPANTAPVRSHPVLLLSGIATNALTFDLDQKVSLARFLSSHGFDTWILELRGAGLSRQVVHGPERPPATGSTAAATEEDAGSEREGEEEVELSTSRETEDADRGRNGAARALDVASWHESSNGAVASAQQRVRAAKEVAAEVAELAGAAAELRSHLQGVTAGRQARQAAASIAQQRQGEEASAVRSEVEELIEELSGLVDGEQQQQEEEESEQGTDRGMRETNGAADSMQPSLSPWLGAPGLPASSTGMPPSLPREFHLHLLRELLERLCSLRAAEGQEQVEAAAWRVVDDADIILVGGGACLRPHEEELLRRIRSAAARVVGLPDRDWGPPAADSAGEDAPASAGEGASAQPVGVGALLDALARGAPSLALSPGSLPVPSPQPLLELAARMSGLLQAGQRQALQSPLAQRIVRLRAALGGLLTDSRRASSARLMLLSELLLRAAEETLGGAADWASYSWDFDTYLYEDLPPAVEYIRRESAVADGKILAVGHSMGGILLYSRLAALGQDAGLQGVVTVASAMDYGMSDSVLKLLKPLLGPAKTLQVPVIPLGVLARASMPLVFRPPFSLRWVLASVTAGEGCMDDHVLHRMFRWNFGTVPLSLLEQMVSVLLAGGLRSRSGSILYLKGLRDCRTPVLALAGDADPICPPIAVTETLKSLPAELAQYQLFGGESGGGASPTDADAADQRCQHYSHYDLLVGKNAPETVFPAILDFLATWDRCSALPPQSAPPPEESPTAVLQQVMQRF